MKAYDIRVQWLYENDELDRLIQYLSAWLNTYESDHGVEIAIHSTIYDPRLGRNK